MFTWTENGLDIIAFRTLKRKNYLLNDGPFISDMLSPGIGLMEKLGMIIVIEEVNLN